MRLSTTALFPTALVLLPFPRVILAQASSALTLSIFQPINGFSDACTKAYNTPLTDCSNADFSGRGCSAKCIGFLDNLTNLLTTTCRGTSAYPTTLIGLFLMGNGVHTVCSNAEASPSASNGGNGYGQGGQNGAPPVQSASIEVTTSTTTSSTTTTTSISSSSSSSTSSTTSSTPQAATTSKTTKVIPTTTSTPKAAATTSTTTVVPITVTPEPTTTSVAVVETTVVPASPSDSSTGTSHTTSSTASSSRSTSTGNGNGGGTPLDVGSSACRDAAVSVWLFALLGGLAGVTWLL